MESSLFSNVDCVSFYVDNLDDGIAFYCGALGLKLLWRAADSCGLAMSADDTEVVLVCRRNPTVDFKVESVERALTAYVEAGGTVVYGPFDIDIGKCAVVADKWGNKYCLLDMSKGTYDVDESGKVTGVSK